ncbi:MAG TPA: iron-containing alcohol dehydrogenase, partial [Anseongella sp.]|nr:iron-containing alcohol dehydrogenase [Anseongella sp.]
ILLDEKEALKKGIISPYLVPDAVYVDPLITRSVPPEVTAATGLDALTHCIEAYANKFAHPLIDVYALEGIRLISSSLAEAVRDGDNISARSDMALGSLLGGLCLGPVNTAAIHALSYPLGSRFHIPHGLSNALLMPHVISFNLPAAPERYAAIALAMGCRVRGSAMDTALEGISLMEKIMADCKVPRRLSEINIPRDAIAAMAQDALKITRLLKNNPRELSMEDAVAIYEAAY